MMTVALLDRTRNSPQLYCLFLASSDLTQEVKSERVLPLASLLVSLFSCLMEVIIYIYIYIFPQVSS